MEDNSQFSTEDSRLALNSIIIWLLLLIGGLIFFLINNQHEGVWYDETIAFFRATHSLKDVIFLCAKDIHPPLHFIFLWAVLRLFGNSVFFLRGLSALASIALAALGIGPVRRLAGIKTGLIFTLLLIITPSAFEFSREMRNYSWGAFFTAGAVLYFYLAVRGNLAKDWILAGLFGFLCVYTNYNGMIALIISNMILFVLSLVKARDRLPAFISVNLIIAALYVPWVVINLENPKHTMFYSFFSVPMTIKNLVIAPFYYKLIDPPITVPVTTLPALLLILAVIIAGFIYGKKIKERYNPFVYISFAVYLLTLSSIALLMYTFNITAVSRHMFLAIGLLIFPLAYGFSFLKLPDLSGHKMGIRELLLAGLILYPILALPLIVNMETKYINGPIKEAVSFLKDNVRDGDIFLHVEGCTTATFSYYFPRYNHYFFTNDIKNLTINFKNYAPVVTVINDMDPVINNNKRIWLCSSTWGVIFPSQAWLESVHLRIVSNIGNTLFPDPSSAFKSGEFMSEFLVERKRD
ncbi:MAG: glycosyltransferase family 39 protein [Brevinematales bacterium]